MCGLRPAAGAVGGDGPGEGCGEGGGDGGAGGVVRSPETWFFKSGRHVAVVCLSLQLPGPLANTGPWLMNTHAVQLPGSAAHMPQQAWYPGLSETW